MLVLLLLLLLLLLLVEPLITDTAGEFQFCPLWVCSLLGVRQVTIRSG
jgi:hypothetical protein